MSISQFNITMPQNIHFGRGVSADASRAIAAIGKRVLLVTGSSPNRSDWFFRDLLASGCDVSRFSTPYEPDLPLIELGVAQAREFSAEVIVALGGGSVIDAAKAIAGLQNASHPIMNYLEVVGTGQQLETQPTPMVALPTTSGTGSEATKNSVILVPSERRKVSLRDQRLLPDLVFIDPSLTDECPKSITLSAGLDAITQVIEPYICTRATPFTDALCKPAISDGLSALHALMERECPIARDTLAWVSLCGGVTLANAGLGVVHGLAGPLGGLSKAPHGSICGTLLPHCLEANQKNASTPAYKARIDNVALLVGEMLHSPHIHAFSNLDQWTKDNGLLGLSSLGIDADMQKTAAEIAATASSMALNPAQLNAQQLVLIQRNAS